MSKKRELLEKRLAEYNDDTSCMTFATHRHLKEQLAQLPREPLSDEEIFAIGYKAGFAIDTIERDLAFDYGFLDEDGGVDNEPYFKLVRAIEKAHGIGEIDE